MFYSNLSGTTQVIWYRKKTYTHSHVSWSSTILYQLPPSTVIRSIILPVQFMYLTIFLHNLSASPLWSTSWSETCHFTLLTSLHPIFIYSSSFHNTCPHHHNLFCCSTEIMSSILILLPPLLLLFTALWILSGTTRVSQYQKGKTMKVKPIWIYWNKRW